MIKPADKSDEDVPQDVLDELNRMLAEATQAYNAEPVPEMGGLSADQVTHLIYSEWGEADSAIQFNTDIPLAELDASAFYRESRTFLKALLDAGGARATTSRNLPRRFVPTSFRSCARRRNLKRYGTTTRS